MSEKVKVWPMSYFAKPFYLFDAIRISRKISKEKKIDLVISQDPTFSGFAGFIVSKIIKAKHLTSIFGDNIYDPKWRHESWSHFFLYFIGAFVLSTADAIQADGLRTVAELEKRFQGKVFWKPIIPLDIGLFSRNKEAHEGVNIIFVNRLVKQKNLSMLVDVLEAITKKQFPQSVKFTLIGDGPLRDQLEGDINERGLKDSVELMHSVDREDLATIMTRQDVLIATSNYEGFGRIFADAAAAGVPVVTTDVGEARHTIGDGVGGFIIPIKDTRGFISKLSELISNEGLREQMSENIRKNWTQNYSPELTITKQKSIFDYIESTIK